VSRIRAARGQCVPNGNLDFEDECTGLGTVSQNFRSSPQRRFFRLCKYILATIDDVKFKICVYPFENYVYPFKDYVYPFEQCMNTRDKDVLNNCVYTHFISLYRVYPCIVQMDTRSLQMDTRLKTENVV
jgi:hypothetical protein